MEWIKLAWDVLKTAWDFGKHVGPWLSRRFRNRRSPWQVLVRQGAQTAGTPADEIDELLAAFDDSAFYVTRNRHPLLVDVRRSLWRIHQRLDELRLLATAERSTSVTERCWAIGQIGQRSFGYALPVLESIANCLSGPDQVRQAARRAASEIRRRESNNPDKLVIRDASADPKTLLDAGGTAGA
jgi:hypothetical protein